MAPDDEAVAVALARLDERLKGVEADVETLKKTIESTNAMFKTTLVAVITQLALLIVSLLRQV